METLDALLNDQFISFSQKIAEVYAAKIAKKEDFKKQYEQFQAEMKALDDQARAAKKEYDDWITSKTSTPIHISSKINTPIHAPDE